MGLPDGDARVRRRLIADEKDLILIVARMKRFLYDVCAV
jgi:hypothetical protein